MPIDTATDNTAARRFVAAAASTRFEHEGDDAPSQLRLRGVQASTIRRKPIRWLWKPYLQVGAINLLSGDPGIGKSTIICEIVAALTAGRALPGQAPLPPQACWIMNGEDNAEDTIVWRLHNQGADMSRVFITDRPEAITEAVTRELLAECRARRIGFVSLDPLQSWMGAGVDMHRANETRAWGSHLRTLASQGQLAVLVARHRRKGAPGDSKLYSGLGSIDISGFARSELAAIEGKGDTHYVERIKGNVGQTGEQLMYHISPSPEPGNDHGVLRWGAASASAGPASAANTPKKLPIAVGWLRDTLSQGPRPVLWLIAEAQKQGVTERTLRRAKNELGADAQKGPDGEWKWSLGAAQEAA